MPNLKCKEALASFKKFIPPLQSNLHKGSNGRIGVIGGSLEYTGAPYFAAISALKAGADLVHVFCTKSAAPVIKSYSPELIVHPLLDGDNAVNKVAEWLGRLHALVIGPGLGRDGDVLQTVKAIINRAPNFPIIFDADGLFLLNESREILNDFSRPLLLTPNAIEYQRLLDHSKGLPSAIYMKKGEVDEVWEQHEGSKINPILCDEPGSSRRCGGQGDVLSGITGLFAAWVFMKSGSSLNYEESAIAASALTRRCSHLSFAKYKRGMLASNLIEFIPQAFETMFES